MGDNLSSEGIQSFGNAIALGTPQIQRNSNQTQPPMGFVHINSHLNQNQIQSSNFNPVPFAYSLPQNHPIPLQPQQQPHQQPQYFQYSHSSIPPYISTPAQIIPSNFQPSQPPQLPQPKNFSSQNNYSPYR